MCRVDLHKCKCSGTRLLSASLAEQHRAKRHVFCNKQCCCEAVFGDCTPVCRVDLHRCKCRGTRLLSAGLALQHKRKRQAFYRKTLQQCTGGHCKSVCSVDLHNVNAVAQGCCQLVWHSSSEEQGRQSTQNTAAVHWCMVTANLFAVSIFIAVNAVA